jgi:hypothetical protein
MAVIGMALIVLTQISTVARRPEVDAPTFWYIAVRSSTNDPRRMMAAAMR